MKRILYTLVSAVLAPLFLMAQPAPGTFSITPRAGVTLPYLTSVPRAVVSVVMPDNDANANTLVGRTAARRTNGYYFGCDAQYQFTKVFALSAGLGYSFQGTKYADYDNSEIAEKNERVVKIFDTKVNLHYLTLPVMANVYVAEGLALRAGVQPAYCVKHDMESRIGFEKGGYDDRQTLGNVRKFDFSIPVGISYEYENVVLGAQYNIGMSDVLQKDYVSMTPGLYAEKKAPRNSVFLFTVGYKFAF